MFVCWLATEQGECEAEQIQCPTTLLGEPTRRCIHSTWRCDGDNDCGDLSDEQDCDNHQCEGEDFQCSGSPRCFRAAYRWDGYATCSDTSDEIGCKRIISVSFYQICLRIILSH